MLALLSLLVGLALGRLMPGRVPGEQSPEVTFARDMSLHHEQAVEMAMIMRDRSADSALRTLALDILLTQQAQIGQMSGWLELWGKTPTGLEPPMGGHSDMMGMASQAEIAELQTLPVPEAEVAFLQLMIRHHQGGVAMAQEALRQTRHPQVVRLATAIVNGQQGEIAYMQDLLQQRGAAPAGPLQPTPDHEGAHP